MRFRQFHNITPKEPWSRETGAILQWTRNGKTNNVGQLILTAGTVTVLTDDLISPDSLVVITAEDILLTFRVDGYDYRTCNVHHGVAVGGETVRYAVIG